MSTVTPLQSRKLVSTLSTNNVVHSYHDEEKQSLVEHLNFLLANEPLLKSRIPINPKSDLIFDSLKDGIILSKLINAIKPGVLNEATIKLNTASKELNLFEMNVNLEKCLAASKRLGCSIINIGPTDFQEGKRHLILSILWQLIKIDLLNKVSKLASRVKAEILDLGEKENVEDLVADDILLRWVNHHLGESGVTDKRVSNFGSDIKDCEVYLVLFNQLSPKTCSLDGLKTSDLTKRAIDFLEMIDRIGCKKFISAQDIVSGNARLNIAFVAYLFNRFNQAKEEAPAVPSEIIKSADDKIQSNIEEAKILEKEIQEYQEKNIETAQKIKEIQERIELKKKEDQEIEEKFQEKVQIYTQELETQRDQFQEQIKALEEQLKVAEEEKLPSVDELKEMIAQEENERIQIEENGLKALESTIEEIKTQGKQFEESRAKIEEEIQKEREDLEDFTKTLEKEKEVVIQKLDATGILETKKKLEEIKQQAQQIETQITELKENEKELKGTLNEAKEDKHRISIAKKKIQDELNRAKENTEKIIKTRFETDRQIDKTTRQVKDIKYEIDRIKNDKVYIQQQTQVLKVELIEAEEQVEEIKTEKKRVLVRKQELKEDLLEKEIELDQVILEKEEKVDTSKKQHRETIDKMKREFESAKRSNQEEKNVLKEKLIAETSQLLREEFNNESEKRALELQEMKAKSLEIDVHAEAMEKQFYEEQIERVKKESTKVNKDLEKEREINKILEEKNKELWKEKSILRENTTKAAIEAYEIQKENREAEVKTEKLITESDELETLNNKIALHLKDEQVEIDLKKGEVKDEKRRLKKLVSTKKLEEKERIEKIEMEYSKDLTRLKAFEDLKAKEIQDTIHATEDLEIKTSRLNDKMHKTQLEIETISSKFESIDTKKLADKKQKLENTLAIAKGIIDEKKKDKDQVLKDFEISSNKQKLLAENHSHHSKSKKSSEQKKKELEERLAKLKSQSIESSEQQKKWLEESESKAKVERDRIKKEMERDHSKLLEKLESQTKEEEENFVKKQEQNLNKLQDSIQKSKKEEERLSEKIQTEKDEFELSLERKKRKEEREKKKLQREKEKEEEEIIQ